MLKLECCVGRRLDYDSIVDHTYNFTITATDNGYPVAHSGSAMVRVSVTNVNDEDPVFMQSVEHILVSEDAMTNTVIHVVQAYDPDGDDVTFSFTGLLPSGRLSLRAGCSKHRLELTTRLTRGISPVNSWRVVPWQNPRVKTHARLTRELKLTSG